MSNENVTPTPEKSVANMTQEERMEHVKTVFASLEVDNRAVVANWCHENVKTGAADYMTKKMQKVNDDMNSMIANASDKILNTGEKIYNGTNQAFKDITGDDSAKSDIFD